jgi:hypothetical protein
VVSVMHVLGVRVLVPDPPVRVLVRMGHARVAPGVHVLVVAVVVAVRVRVGLGRVLVRVLVMLGEMEPDTRRDRGGAGQREPAADRLSDGDRGHGADERPDREHTPGARGSEPALREEVELEAAAVADRSACEEPGDRRNDGSGSRSTSAVPDAKKAPSRPLLATTWRGSSSDNARDNVLSMRPTECRARHQQESELESEAARRSIEDEQRTAARDERDARSRRGGRSARDGRVRRGAP